MHHNDRDDVEKEITFDWKAILAAGMGIFGMVWLNSSFVLSAVLFIIKAFAIFLLACAGWYSVLLVCRPRRIVTDEHEANHMTRQEFLVRMQRYNPFMQDSRTREMLAEPKVISEWDIRKGFLAESSSSLLWLLVIVFLTFTGETYRPLDIIAAPTVIMLCVNWLRYLLIYDRWPTIGHQAAKTEHYGVWLLERVQYGFVLLYCIDFAAYKVGFL